MKRRIIAALTALVMVVTMIPASAFAQSYTVQDVEDLIKYAVKSHVVEYTAKADLDRAKAAYDSLGSKVNEVNDDLEKDLLDAVKVFALYQDDVNNVNALMANVKPGSVTPEVVADGNSDFAKARAAFNKVKGEIGVYEYKNDASSVTLQLPKDAKELETLMKGLVKEYIAINTIVYLDTDANTNLNAMDAMKGVTSEQIADIDASNYNSNKAATTAKGISLKGDYYDAYMYLAAGYDKYIAAMEKYNFYADLKGNVDSLTSYFTGTVLQSTVKETVAKIKTIYASATDKKTFEDNMAKAKSIVDANGEKIDPDFSSAEYKTFVEKYQAVKEAVAKYESKDAVEKQIRELPSTDAIAKADYAQLVAYYDQFAAIDADVVGVTDLVARYEAVRKALDDRMGSFDDAYVAADYAKKFVGAVAKIPADATRNDITAVNDAVKVLLAYKDLNTTADATSVNAAEKNIFNNESVLTLVKTTDLNAAIGAATLKAEIDKLDKVAYDKLVKAHKTILDAAKADKAKIDGVYANITELNGKTINGEESALEAQKIIDKFNKEYAELTGFAKTDFDTVYGAAAAKSVAKATAEIVKYIVDGDTLLAKNRAVEAITALLNIQRSNTAAGNAEYNKSVAYINTVENIIKEKPAVVELLKKEDAVTGVAEAIGSDKLYGQYVERKAYIEDLTAESKAPTAVINAIKALPVVKADADKATIDSAIASYDAAAKMYNALSSVEKAAVTNHSNMKVVSDAIKVAVINLVDSEVAKIGFYNNAPLSDAQKATINGVTSMIAQYKVVKLVDGTDLVATEGQQGSFNATTGTVTVQATVLSDMTKKEEYANACAKLKSEVTNAAKAEYDLIVPLLKAANIHFANNAFKVDKTTANDIIKAVDAVNGLSKEAREYAESTAAGNDKLSSYNFAEMLVAYKEAKALVLDYATVEVKDVEFDGTPATPEVVVKDSNGIVVDSKEYTVAYSDNEKPGTAKVIVTAKADGKYLGSVTKEFKVIAKELAKVENVKFDTDYGIVRVIFDRTADIEGIDVRYQVQYKKTTSDKWITKYPTKGYEYLTLRDLTKNGKYDVRVRAYTDDYGTERVYGEYSDVKEVYANRNGAKSGIMYKAVIKSLSTKSSSVTMTVSPVKYQTIPQGVTWTFSCKKYGSQYTTWTTKTTKSTTATFKNLKKGTKYVVRAQYSYTSAVDGKTTVKSNFSTYKYIVVK